MTTYIETFAVFAVLGGYVFLLYRQWFQHLKALAAHYDVSERRRQAARRYPVVILLLTGPLLGVLFGSLRLLGKTHGLLLVLLLACSVAPASIWWARQMPSLRTLGYGRRRP
jgi:hypothetical protein